MVTSLRGRKVLIAGATKNIGKGCADIFFAEGAMVVLTCRDETCGMKIVDELNELAGFQRAFFVKADIG